MWVRFNRDFSWKPHSQVTIDYKAGDTMNVRSECGRAAIAKGAAVKLEKNGKGDGGESN